VSTTRRTLLLVAGVALVASGCAGPRSSIELSFKQYASTITLGPGATPATAVPSLVPRSNAQPVGFPALQPLPPPPLGPVTVPAPSVAPTATAVPTRAIRGVTPSTAPPAACPPAPAGAVAAVEAGRSVAWSPSSGVLPFRNVGSVEVTDATGAVTRTPYPAQTSRIVQSEVPAGDGTFSYSIVEKVGSSTTTTTYYVEPTSGIYVSRIVTRLSDGSSDTFTPADRRSLPVLPLPAIIGAPVQGVGVDPITQTAVSVDGKITAKSRVDGCGRLMDAWRVEMTGRTVSPGKQLVFTRTYDIGTQYGGLVLRETIDLGCDPQAPLECDGGRNVHATNVATISTVPPIAGKNR
jgi:hypothetical protein